MKLTINPSAVPGNLPIHGDHQTWREKVQTFCRRHGLAVNEFIAVVTRALHPDVTSPRGKRPKSVHQRRIRDLVHTTQAQFNYRDRPVVPDFLRRIVVHLMELIRSGQPIPITHTV